MFLKIYALDEKSEDPDPRDQIITEPSGSRFSTEKIDLITELNRSQKLCQL